MDRRTNIIKYHKSDRNVRQRFRNQKSDLNICAVKRVYVRMLTIPSSMVRFAQQASLHKLSDIIRKYNKSL